MGAEPIAFEQLDWYLGLAREIVEGTVTPEVLASRIGEPSDVFATSIYIAPADGRYDKVIAHFDQKTRRVTSVGFRVATGGKLPALAQLEARLGPGLAGSGTDYRQPLGLSFTFDLGPSHGATCLLHAEIDNELEPRSAWRLRSLSLSSERRL
jgi:hypothetical protein